MVNIPIEVKQTGQASQRDIKQALNLNRVFSVPAAPEKPKNKTKVWLSAVILLAMISAGLGVKIWLDSQKRFSQYQDLIGSEIKTAVFLKTDHLESIIGLAAAELKKDTGFFLWLKERITSFLAGSQISAADDLLPLFQDEAFFFVSPASPSQGGSSGVDSFIWAAGGKIKSDQNLQVQRVLEKIARALRQNFGVSELLYRQTKINSAYSFNQINRPYYWSQIDGFVLVSNNLEAMQGIIDRVIDK